MTLQHTPRATSALESVLCAFRGGRGGVLLKKPFSEKANRFLWRRPALRTGAWFGRPPGACFPPRTALALGGMRTRQQERTPGVSPAHAKACRPNGLSREPAEEEDDGGRREERGAFRKK